MHAVRRAPPPPGPSSNPGPSKVSNAPRQIMDGEGFAPPSELKRYRMISNIGKGSFGIISRVERVDDGKEFALKELDYSRMSEKDKTQISAEVAILESLKHRNIVQLVQKIKDPQLERIYIVMEYCTSGDLGSVIRKAKRNNQPLHEEKIWNIFLQITLALHHCHWPDSRSSSSGTKNGRPSGASSMSLATLAETPSRCQVLHRDLKPENVFLSGDSVKLGDFGLSKDMGTSAFTSTYVGTPLYMPPEILGENRYDTKSDIWSLGCLVYELCALESPFSTARTEKELIGLVKSGKLPPLPPQYSASLQHVIKAMLTLNPVKRPSTKDLLSMEEMQLHRKLFNMQNQMQLLLQKKGELLQWDEQLRNRAAEYEAREKALSEKEAEIAARETALSAREEEVKDTQKRLNDAATTLRLQWDKFRDEKDRHSGDIIGLSAFPDERAPIRRMSTAPSRPNLEERATFPLLPASRFSTAGRSAFDDTPSKIPMAPSGSPVQDRFPSRPAGTPLRRNATKSLGNIRENARMDSERLAAAYAALDLTPSKQMMRSSFAPRGRTSIGSPGEVRVGLPSYLGCEDVSMASMASPMSNVSPYVPRTRKTSIGDTAGATCPSPPPLPTISDDGASESEEILSPYPSFAPPPPPTMIPAPTFVYREAATPAKWSAEDPDLPSPFIKRPSTAPSLTAALNAVAAAANSGNNGSSAGSAAAPAPTSAAPSSERPVLGALNLQSTAQAVSGATGPSFDRVPRKAMSLAPTASAGMPRSKSTNLMAHVLRSNALAVEKERRTSGGNENDPPVAQPRPRSGYVIR